MGTGLSLEFELCEFERAFSPLVEEEDSLLDLRFRRSPGISEVTVCLNAERRVRPDDARRQSFTQRPIRLGLSDTAVVNLTT